MSESQSLRILIVGINFSPEETGIAPYTAGMAEGLSCRGHAVHVVTTFPHYPQWRFSDGSRKLKSTERKGLVDVTRYRHFVPRQPTGLFRAVSELSFGARACAGAWSSPDVILCVSPALLATAMVICRAIAGGRRPAVGVVVQDLYSAGIEEQGGARTAASAFKRIESWVLRSADGIAAIHPRFKDRLVSSLGVAANRVAVVRNWTHLPPVARVDRLATRRSLGWNLEETIVLHSGAMGQKQDLMNVVRAAHVANGIGAPLRFVLMGDGGQRRMLERAADNVGNLDFLDPLPGDQYGHALRSADVLLVNEKPGLVEMAVPSKLTSYFSAGIPVLAAAGPDSTTADELAASGAGARVDPGDASGLVEAILRLRDDPRARHEMGSRGPAYCERVLSEDLALDAYDAWVRKLYARKHGGQ